MLVMSQIKDLKNEPILALCQMSETELSKPRDAVINVHVSKGVNVVLDASVTAVVRNTAGLSCPVRLYDDGYGTLIPNFADPDLMAQDGMYSGYFTQFTGRGRYSVVTYVYGDEKTTLAYREPGFPPDVNIIAGKGPGPSPSE
ncbi:hypothetical protein HPB49_005009 [Dermacentor silvarum]|uniref:Uncharacterized protein n=1 Tax=Dermacentor silvarum TaxID=543639 RepID=A0ACB8DN16_DERSI|nr:hypothetical protein HPB49_005009 [Dermacentor silvarum]